VVLLHLCGLWVGQRDHANQATGSSSLLQTLELCFLLELFSSYAGVSFFKNAGSMSRPRPGAVGK